MLADPVGMAEKKAGAQKPSARKSRVATLGMTYGWVAVFVGAKSSDHQRLRRQFSSGAKAVRFVAVLRGT
jgi:hypothetical protein